MDPFVQLALQGKVTLPPTERYSDERILEFQGEAEMTEDELIKVRQRWRVDACAR